MTKLQKSSFLWGTATSAHQIEGYNQASDWWHWEKQGNIEGGASSGPATDHWNRFRDDIALMAELGLNSYRFSVEWAKLEPTRGKWNQEAIDWYKGLLGECEKHKIVPMLTLQHFTLPKWLADKGGLCAETFAADFAHYTKKVAKLFGAKVPLWCTFNEPMVQTLGSYFGKFMPPAEHNAQKVALACRNLLDAHVRSYDILHSEIAKPVQVGIAHNMFAFYPDRLWHPLEIGLAKILSSFYNDSWLNAVTGKKQHFGIPQVIPYAEEVKSARNRVTADFIGLNYYTKLYVRWRPRNSDPENIPGLPIGLSFARRNEPQSDLGWAIHPEGFGKLLKGVSKYNLPIYVTENGIADKDDSRRTTFISEHLQELSRAKSRGIDVRGYYYWSLLDNFEWSKGFSPRFGLAHVNYENFTRTLRPSAHFYKEKIKELKL